MILANLQDQITLAVEKLSKSVVSISTFHYDRSYRLGLAPMKGQGSGVIIDERGHIVTNSHVVGNAEQVRVMLKDGTVLAGRVVAGDSATDVAVVKVDSSGLRAAELGDSDRLKVGQFAIVIGNALGLPGAPTVSVGVVSAVGRLLPGGDFISEGFIQTDASINPGNSDGPLADIEG